jgi:hypothetical protein
MATIARATTWSSAQVLTAAALNAEFDNIVTAWNAADGASSIWANVNATTFKKSGFTGIIPLQLILATSTTAFSTTSATYVNTNLTASITPKSTSSKVLVMAMGYLGDAGADTAYATLAQGGANILAASGGAVIDVGGASISRPVTLIYLGSPASTSAVTYSVQVKNSAGAVTVSFGATGMTQVMILAEFLMQHLLKVCGTL